MKFSLKREDKKESSHVEPEIITPSIESKALSSPVVEESPKFNAWDYVRVVNVRGDPEFQATSEEKVIIGHRANPILGNNHPMKVQTMKERDRVIEEHKNDLEADLAIKGPIWKALQEIAKEIVEHKQKIAISCHCSPSRCHNDLYIPIIVDMVNEMLSLRLDSQSSKKVKI